jgi:hypothetical protein
MRIVAHEARGHVLVVHPVSNQRAARFVVEAARVSATRRPKHSDCIHVVKVRIADIDTRLVHVATHQPSAHTEKDQGVLLCQRLFVWDHAPPWFVDKSRKQGYVIGGRRSFEAMVTCLECIARDPGDGT